MKSNITITTRQQHWFNFLQRIEESNSPSETFGLNIQYATSLETIDSKRVLATSPLPQAPANGSIHH